MTPEEINQKIQAIQNAFTDCEPGQFTKLQAQLNQSLGWREGYTAGYEKAKTDLEESKEKDQTETKKPHLKAS